MNPQSFLLQDVSSLRDFYEVNLELALPGAPISFYEVEEGIISAGHVLPPAIISGCDIEHTLIGEGAVLNVGPVATLCSSRFKHVMTHFCLLPPPLFPPVAPLLPSSAPQCWTV